MKLNSFIHHQERTKKKRKPLFCLFLCYLFSGTNPCKMEDCAAAVKYNLNCITTLVWTLSRLDWLSLERTWGQRLQFVTTKGKCSKKINLKIAGKHLFCDIASEASIVKNIGFLSQFYKVQVLYSGICLHFSAAGCDNSAVYLYQ